jgi:uncharacterized protein (DUF2164 family)
MAKRSGKFDFESDEARVKFIKEIITFFKRERDEEIGMIAAENILGFFLQTIGEDVYRKGVNDAKKLLRERFEDLEVDLDVLSQNQ